jgi:predicted nucleic acid-binding protein
MSARVFFDTNILIYAVTQANHKSQIAEALLTQGGYISVQVLNEFASVARRKLGMDWPEVTSAVTAIRILCHPPLPVSIATHESALRIGIRYGFSMYDCLILASALEAKCKTVYSEDLSTSQVIADTLTIKNPFS